MDIIILLITVLITATVVGVGGYLYSKRYLEKHMKEMQEIKKECDRVFYVLETTWKSLQSYILLMDKDKNIILCSYLLAKQTGYASEKELIGKNIYSLHGFVWGEDLENKIVETLSDNRVFRETVKIADDVGRDIWVDLFVQKIKKEGMEKRILILFTDVTKDYKQKDALMEVVEMRDKMFMAMSHEFRTPLNAITGSTELLAMETNLNEHAKNCLKNIKTSCHTLTKVLEQITDYSNLKAEREILQEKPFFLEELINEIRPSYGMTAKEKNVNLRLCVEASLPQKMIGDKDKLQKVITRLVQNALQFTSQGCVTLSISEMQRKEKRYIQFKVEDTGIGIEEKYLKSIFNATARFENEYEEKQSGLGLGLPICEELVHIMNGEITCQSVYGEGSSFQFYIPLKEASQEEFAKVYSPDELKILYCSDNPWKIENFKNMCEQLHIRNYMVASELDNITDTYTHVFIGKEYEYANTWLKKNTGENCKKILIVPFGEKFAQGFDVADRIVYEPFAINMFADIVNMHVSEQDEKNEEIDTKIFKTKNIKALVVDDNVVNLMVASNILQQFNIEVEEADSGTLAIRKYYENEYHVILMDYLMPGIDGVETTRNIRNFKKKGFKPVIIALSANVTEDISEQFKDAGANEVMAKPIDLAELCRILKKWIPKEQIIYDYAYEAEESGQKNLEILESALAEIEGLDIKRGLNNVANSVENYVKVLRACVNNVIDLLSKIKAGSKVIQLTDMQIHFHSLKGIMANVGMNDMAEMSRSMELAAKEKNESFLLEHMNHYLVVIGEFANNLDKALTIYKDIVRSTNQQEKVVELLGEEELKEKLLHLKNYIERYEYNESSTMIEELIPVTEMERQEVLEEVKEYIQQFEYDLAMEMLEKIL